MYGQLNLVQTTGTRCDWKRGRKTHKHTQRERESNWTRDKELLAATQEMQMNDEMNEWMNGPKRDLILVKKRAHKRKKKWSERMVRNRKSNLKRKKEIGTKVKPKPKTPSNTLCTSTRGCARASERAPIACNIINILYTIHSMKHISAIATEHGIDQLLLCEFTSSTAVY